MSDPTRPEPQKIDPTWRNLGQKILTRTHHYLNGVLEGGIETCLQANLVSLQDDKIKNFVMFKCPFYGIMVMCHHSLYPFKQLNSLQFVFSTSVISTCIWASLLLKLVWQKYFKFIILQFLIAFLGTDSAFGKSLPWQSLSLEWQCS